jgi:hypothetical protein
MTMDESAPRSGRVEPSTLHVCLPEDRVALNETRARRVNEAIEEGRVTRDGPAAFVCECGQLGCNAVIELELEQYEGVRAHARHFLVVDGHQSASEVVVRRAPGYAIVSKHGVAGLIAELTDPRDDGSAAP